MSSSYIQYPLKYPSPSQRLLSNLPFTQSDHRMESLAQEEKGGGAVGVGVIGCHGSPACPRVWMVFCLLTSSFEGQALASAGAWALHPVSPVSGIRPSGIHPNRSPGSRQGVRDWMPPPDPLSCCCCPPQLGSGGQQRVFPNSLKRQSLFSLTFYSFFPCHPNMNLWPFACLPAGQLAMPCLVLNSYWARRECRVCFHPAWYTGWAAGSHLLYEILPPAAD